MSEFSLTEALMEIGTSPDVHDSKGNSANLVDGLSCVATAIDHAAFLLGTGDAATRMGAIEAHAKAVNDVGELVAGVINSVAESINNVAESINNVADGLNQLAIATTKSNTIAAAKGHN